MKIVFGALVLCLTASAQEPDILTLEQAEQLALKNHPRIASTAFTAQAAGTTVKQVRSALQPLLTANLTTVGADRDTSIAAGTLQASGLASRAATGLGVSQLITDFGRTSSLADSARLRRIKTRKPYRCRSPRQYAWRGWKRIAPGAGSMWAACERRLPYFSRYLSALATFLALEIGGSSINTMVPGRSCRWH